MAGIASSVAIVIGIDNYGSSRASLKGPVADAIAFSEWLLTTGYPAEQLYLGLLSNENSAPLPRGLADCPTFDPTLIGLQRLLNPLLPLDTGPLPDPLDRLWCFFSGHGASSSSPYYVENAICLKDFEFGLWSAALELGSLRQVLTSIPARERFLLIDGCRDHVMVGAPLFGRLSPPNRPPGARANYEFYATADGRKTIEKRGEGDVVRGIFSRHLVDGLRGVGAAKRWSGDSEQYVVNWSTVKSYVSARVAEDTATDPATQQLVMSGGEAPVSDPLLATIAADAVAPTTVTVTLDTPLIVPLGTRLIARRTGSSDEDIETEWQDASISLKLPPSTWQLTVRASDWRAQPKMLTIHAYNDAISAVLSMEQYTTVPNIEATHVLGTERWREDAMAKSSNRSLPGGFTLTIAGQAISAMRPAPTVDLRRENGEQVPSGADWQQLDPGIYRLHVESAVGVVTETMVSVEAGTVVIVDLVMASVATTGMLAVAEAADIPVCADGRILPSEDLGWLTGSLATTVAIKASKAAQGATDRMAELGLDIDWPDGGEGVQFVIADEAGNGNVSTELPHARLWRMFKTNGGIHAAMHRGLPAGVLTTARLPAPKGGYWFQLQAPDMGTAGFKVATLVAPGHRSLVIRHLVAVGRVELLQFALPLKMPDATVDWSAIQGITSALVEAEAIQHALMRGIDPLAIAAVDVMLAGAWTEPLTGWAVAARLLERSDAGAVTLLDRLVSGGAIDRLGATTEAAIIHGMRAERTGNHDAAKAHFDAAVAAERVPVVYRLMKILVEAMERHAIKGEVPRWLRAKARQAVDHPLWTLRRADDRLDEEVPDAAR